MAWDQGTTMLSGCTFIQFIQCLAKLDQARSAQPLFPKHRRCQRVTHLGEGDGDGSGVGDGVGLCNHPFHHMLDPTHRWHAGGTWEKCPFEPSP
jgi:hypothetical protein